MMRIISGKARGCKLYSLEGENTRPTGERVKEAVFSMIQFDIEGREVLDLFAGSGQLGLEAISRGAVHADLVDHSKAAVEVIRKNMVKTKLALDASAFCADFSDFLRGHKGRGKYDIVFLDPPYAAGVLPEVLKLLLRYELLKPSSVIVCESASFEDVFGQSPTLSSRYSIKKQAKYGAAHVTILTLPEEETSEEKTDADNADE